MNFSLFAAGVLSVLIGVIHSVLGEKLVLGPLFRRSELPKLLGSTIFARRTLRFTWHLTTVLLVAIGAVAVVLSLTVLEPQSVWILRLFAVTFAACSLLSLVGARGRHFSWWFFLLIATLLWIGTR
ncbi:MAG: hypothetical protein QNL88_01680 [Acidobacteriota bacterium]|nr:hypothetical protein [Acidobacteriota bacterium]